MAHRFRLPSPLAGLAFLAALGGGCTGLALSQSPTAGPNGGDGGGSIGADVGEGDGANGASLDGGPGTDQHSPRPYIGSQLCGRMVGTCNPDVPGDPTDGTCCSQAGGTPISSSTETRCVVDGGPLYDAGTNEAGAPGWIACHVVPDSDGGAPHCSLAGSGHDGASCTGSADCAAGYECISGSNLSAEGTCRHYCCDDICGGGSTGSAPFCDLQPMLPMRGYPSALVPVCVTPVMCTLLQTGTCPTNQTCALVSDVGDSVGRTACVAVGTAGPGQSCETEHCKDGLTCWGTFPNRTCAQLCDTTQMMCPAGEKCVANPYNFPPPQTNVGVCLSSSGNP